MCRLGMILRAVVVEKSPLPDVHFAEKQIRKKKEEKEETYP